MVISPLVGFAVVYLDRRRVRRVGAAVAAAGLVGLLAFLGWAVLTWNTSYGVMTGWAVGMRFVYLVATATALPVVQCGLAGVVMLIATRRTQNRAGESRRADAAADLEP
jgi:uncharacterized membrane protein